ncbi:DUF4386 domain-containing protein [Oceanobacillus piezotolerans]|uniref:DUF4386 domain-containing protein n=1 Tax=Oceanobacillus piezotolerans TaxID=2448030 RepID=A0A498D6U4_9BACI|nr:DUF4386 domain-containing protein [Oceanobacillus piezotolerans]RLL45468.1 DUF4386 domain-containing protein [Oceanobacillus piezotolerans]
MNQHKFNARILGVLYIVAAAASIIGLLLYDPILNHANYLVAGAENKNQIILGALFELLLACSAIGTAIMFFPYLRKQNESIALGYLCFRFFEAILIVVGILCVISILGLGLEYVSLADPNTSAFQASAVPFLTIHEWTFMLGPNFMLGINTFMYSYLLFRSKLVPRSLSIIGLVGSFSVFAAALLIMFDIIEQVSVWGGLLALPIAAFEMTLAFWLIVKGFNLQTL